MVKLKNPEKFNVDLGMKVLDYIERHPEQHDQRFVHCGTAGCVIGWAAVLSGHEIVSNTTVGGAKALGLDYEGFRADEFVSLFGADDEEAKETLRDYIQQGLVAQVSQSEVELVTTNPQPINH